MIRRSLAFAGVALAAMLLLAPAASAQYVSGGTITTDNPTPGVGDSIVVSGFCSTSPVTITLTQGGVTVVVAVVNTDFNGRYSATVTIPSNFSPGPATLSACGESITINIAGAAGVTGVTSITLPRTGSSNTDSMLRIGAGLLAAGGLLVLTARKRAARVSVTA